MESRNGFRAETVHSDDATWGIRSDYRYRYEELNSRVAAALADPLLADRLLDLPDYFVPRPVPQSVSFRDEERNVG